jgi:hypothetical protein
MNSENKPFIKHNTKTYGILIAVFLLSSSFSYLASETISIFVGSSVVWASLMAVLYQILRDQSVYEKQLKLAEFRERHELSTTAIEKRLAAHQEAFSLWWEMKNAPSGEPIEIYSKSLEFLKNYSVYLTDDALKSFDEAVLLLRTFGEVGKDMEPEQLSRLFKELETKGEKIRAALNLPRVKSM